MPALSWGGSSRRRGHSLLDTQREITTCDTTVAVPAALQVIAGQKYSNPKCSERRKVIVSFSVSPLSAKNASQTLGLDE